MRRQALWLTACLVLPSLLGLACGDDHDRGAARVADARFAFEPMSPGDAGDLIRGTIWDSGRQMDVEGRVPAEFLLPSARDRVTGEFQSDGTIDIMATLELNGKIVARQTMRATGGKIVLDSVIPPSRGPERR